MFTTQFHGSVASFWRSAGGSVAIIFSFAVIGLLMVGGIAVDYGRSITTQAKMQAAADAAVLAAVRAATLDSKLNLGQLKQIAHEYFDDNLQASGGLHVNAFALTQAGDGYRVEASAKMPTSLMSVVGFDNVDIGVASQAETGVLLPLEVALALDNTDSMAGAKMDALKDAANLLVDQLMGDGTDPDNQTKIGLVPFDDYVNVGLDKRNEFWISVPNDYSEVENQCHQTYPDKTGCTTTTQTTTCESDGVPYSCQSTTEQCTSWGDPVEVCEDVTKSYVWEGCVGSRDNGLNLIDSDYVSNPVPGILNASCPDNTVTPLTGDKSVISAQIDAMEADSKTYIPAGLAWGWRVLSSHEPYTGGLSYDDMAGQAGLKALVLMTDGANTRAPSFPKGDHKESGSDAEALANTITAQLCTNIKASDITVYTIAFEVTDTTIRDLLEDCASSPSHYFDAADSIQLSGAFQSIASQLAQLRLTK